ncbi:unnamed protein product (macronuclear) [Paramecium tetraurelia]|uniref:arginyltransferase n=1 Tax=Paramecium tetraurelia TaxID=5888 RepID=A0EF10_PARTE|nr:uncharacterized protein GSPATT00026224001 [Paramecium tetraurelia]CAK93901.1 unnamed protein product [Paramecium tetraurelia]|eukprot:XP_001461274.1 hypothetical protein (macronuclear) [Paramecium tetraurelia strain d4-2]
MGCCCLYTSTQTSNSQTQKNQQESKHHCLTLLKKLSSNKSSCLYECGKYQYIYYLKPINNFSIETMELLLERGFVRNAKYYRKYNHNQSCCVGYNTRVNIQENQPKKKQKAIIDTFVNQVIKQYPKVDLEGYALLNQEGDYPQQMNNQQNKKQLKKIQKHIPLEDVQDIMNQVQQELITCSRLINEEIDLNLDFQIKDQQQLKIFGNSEDLGYYTNHNLILFDQNIRALKSIQMVQQQFNQMIGAKLNEKVILDKYKLLQNKNGYFNIVQIRSEQGIKNNNKKQGNYSELKNKQAKQPKQEQKEIQKSKVIDIIDHKTFTVNDFRIGEMRVSIVDPYTSEENAKLYLDYMAKVHSQISNLESFQTYYSTRILLNDQFLYNQGANVKLNLGQRFMEYRIRGKLIGCGVIILTRYQLFIIAFGIVAAFVEIEYVKKINKYFPDFKYSSLSYVIATCKAMNYKLQFTGLEIQCPDSYVWLKYNKELKKLMQSNCSRLNKERQNKMNYNQDFSQVQVSVQNEIHEIDQLDPQTQMGVMDILLYNKDVLGEDLIKGLTFCI